MFKPSAYNHCYSYGTSSVLMFNGVSTALLSVPKSLYASIEPLLAKERFTRDECKEEVQPFLNDLLEANFFVPASFNELEHLRGRTAKAHGAPTLSLTIAPTMDCNLGCYYCFEEHVASKMSERTCDDIITYVEHQISVRGIRSLKVMWFGGEPMLHPEAIVYLSQKLVALCAETGIKYTPSMISNGTCWPDTIESVHAFLKQTSLKNLQFTFDGTVLNHNKRRRSRTDAHYDSFNQMCTTIERVQGAVNLYLRINCDPRNYTDAFTLLDMFVEKGWLHKQSGVFPYVAQVRPHNSSCDFLHKNMLEDTEYNKFSLEFLKRLIPHLPASVIAQRSLPRSLKVACGAVNPNSLMLGPSGELYKCIADYGVPSLSHGWIQDQIRPKEPALLPILTEKSTHHDYLSFDPYGREPCSTCKYLPQCLSGCAKQHLETSRVGGNRANIDSFKRFWDDSLQEMLFICADALSREAEEQMAITVLRQQGDSPLEQFMMMASAQ